jgi:shikimate dehydrogenase
LRLRCPDIGLAKPRPRRANRGVSDTSHESPPNPEQTFTLADLERWSWGGTALAVLGHPIRHSVSPAMHNAALAELAAAGQPYQNWRYFRFEVAPEDLPRALELLQARRFRGVNLTVPHKVIAFERVAEIDPAARPAGAVNTLRWRPDGWHGFNTDGYGLAAGVAEDLRQAFRGADVVLLGAGGAARGAAVECLQQACRSLLIVNRTLETAETLVRDLAGLRSSSVVRCCTAATLPADVPAGALVINATSAGLRPTDPLPIELSTLSKPSAVYDMIYNPPETALLRQARSLGLPAANGLSMLVHQGAKALEIWTGVPAAQLAPTMGRAARAALSAR